MEQQLDKKFTYELAREILNGEIDEFDNNPEGYICSMAWNIADWSDISKLRHGIGFTVTEIENLKAILDVAVPKIINQSKSITELSISLRELSAASDFVSNYVAREINRLYFL